MTTENLIAAAMTAFKAEMEKYNLDTLKNYPGDLDTDLAILTRVAMPGAKFAWKAGHTGTHLFALGLHPKRSEQVTYITRDSASDRFYLLEFFADRIKLTEQTAKAFEELEHTPIPYKQEGSNESFWLTRAGVRIGYCRNEFTGDYQRKKYRSTITPVVGITKLDREALREFANFSVVALAQSLFVVHDEVWSEALAA